jgi:predicted CXXCH cytochrome family protein
LTAKKKVVHQPVGDGDCLECHAPHASKFKYLLKKSIKDTCANCHDDIPSKNAKSVHQPVGDGDCTACHNPHASDKKFLVKKAAPALCWDCHDNFLNQAKFKHDVVDDCLGCHKPHQSKENALLAKNILQLCGDCHDDKDLKAVKAHAGMEGKSCVVCHDPHVGKDKYFLKPGAVGQPAVKEVVPAR